MTGAVVLATVLVAAVVTGAVVLATVLAAVVTGAAVLAAVVTGAVVLATVLAAVVTGAAACGGADAAAVDGAAVAAATVLVAADAADAIGFDATARADDVTAGAAPVAAMGPSAWALAIADQLQSAATAVSVARRRPQRAASRQRPALRTSRTLADAS